MSLESQEQKLAAMLERQQAAASNSVEGQTAVPKPTEEPIKPEAVEAPKEPEPKVEEKQPEVEQTPVSTKAWDEDEETQVSTTPTSVFDFKKLGSALDLGEIKDENELVTKVSELKSLKKQLEENQYHGIPEEFKEVLEVTKKSGDWKAFLAEQLADYTKANPLDLYEESYFQAAAQLPEFKNPDGTINEKAIYESIDAIPAPQRMFEGNRIKSQLLANQQARKSQLAYQAQEKVAQADKNLNQATKSLNDLLPFENYGIKFEPKHSAEIYEGLTSSKLTKKHLGVSYDDLVRSGADMKAVTRTVAAAEYAEKMVKFKAQNSKAEAKREILAKTQNAQIQTPGSIVQPENPEQKVLSPAERMKSYLESLKKQNPLR